MSNWIFFSSNITTFTRVNWIWNILIEQVTMSVTNCTHTMVSQSKTFTKKKNRICRNILKYPQLWVLPRELFRVRHCETKKKRSRVSRTMSVELVKVLFNYHFDCWAENTITNSLHKTKGWCTNKKKETNGLKPLMRISEVYLANVLRIGKSQMNIDCGRG